MRLASFCSAQIDFTTSKISYDADKDNVEPVEGETETATATSPPITAAMASWDDNMKEVRGATEEEVAADADNEIVNGMIEIFTPEPASTPLPETTPQTQKLLCTGVSDTTKFECDTASIVFKSAAMFQTRKHEFVVTNKGETQLVYDWKLDNVPASMRPFDAPAQSIPQVPCPFTIEPSDGAIAANSDQQFVVKFSPLEVDDFCYVASCNMPGLATAAARPAEEEDNPNPPPEPLKISMRAKASRPIVHFELGDQNDYLSRRPANLRNELGLFGQIEASSVRAVETESRGTRVRNTKRFHVVNPTASAYHFTWVPQGNPSPAWRCVTSSGMILAGKRGEMVFEYTPDDVNVAESFFRFQIENTR